MFWREKKRGGRSSNRKEKEDLKGMGGAKRCREKKSGIPANGGVGQEESNAKGKTKNVA